MSKATVPVQPRFRVRVARPDGSIHHARTYNRSGGSPAAYKLWKPVKRKTKRARFLKWFLDAEDGAGRSIGAAMTNFDISRECVIAHWRAIRQQHGIGYTVQANTITPHLPPGCDPANVFRA